MSGLDWSDVAWMCAASFMLGAGLIMRVYEWIEVKEKAIDELRKRKAKR